MLEVKLKLDDKQVRKISDSLRHMPNGTQKALASAINKVLPGVRTDAVRAVAKVYTVKQSEARGTMTIRKASRSKAEGAVRSDGSPIPLIKFSVRPKSVTKKRPKRGLTVQVKRGQAKRLPGGFIAQMGSGHIGVYTRKGKKRFPIEERHGPAVPSMLKDTGAHETIQQQADARLAKAVDHEIYRILKGFGK